MSATEARVLIIEDNDALRVMLFTVLRHQPLGVDTAVGAEDALEKTRVCDYALILIDMNLPDDESFTFLKSFREERPEGTSFILAVRDPNREIALDSTHVSAIVNKPLEIDTLAHAVRECALVVPPPEEPLNCPPAESDFRTQFDDSGAFFN
ncbi:MAG: two-component system, autoinducer sensor kinase/phosphatase CqsS [Thermoanaerobaculia bacterium]|jgi:two-component system response regulator PilR (NtrC family)|nr:two-component system, autoinducer sensor kinase/phosphatase CqsS [Thermoanaerobaculia bacterium]